MTKIILDVANNHLGQREILDKLIGYPPSNMVDYIKFQLYNPERLNKDYPNYSSYKKLCDKYYINKETLIHIFKEFNWTAQKKPMFTIFSEDRIEFLQEVLDELGYSLIWPVDFALKIASPDMSNYRLIDSVLRAFPELLVIISTGMHSDKEIDECINRLSVAGHRSRVKFLHCISEYPTDPEDIDWGKIKDMDGFSDHTIGIETAKKCIALNVEYLEFHFTLSKDLPGKDHTISKDIKELDRILRFKLSLMNNENYKVRWCG